MHATTTATHPDERLLEAVRQFGEWLAADERSPALERLALVLDDPIRHELLADLAPRAFAAA